MLWCTELDTAENFGLTSIQQQLIAISKCPLLNIHPVQSNRIQRYFALIYNNCSSLYKRKIEIVKWL